MREVREPFEPMAMLIQIALIYRLAVALSLAVSQFLSTQSTKRPARIASSGIEMRLIAGIDAYCLCLCDVMPLLRRSALL